GAPATAPQGWMRIGLPTWRGYEGGGYDVVPAELYEPRETWIRPRLRAIGLTTCYGEPGLPRRTLYDAHGHGTHRPWVSADSEAFDPLWWPATEAQRDSIQQLATDWFDDVARRLSEMAGDVR